MRKEFEKFIFDRLKKRREAVDFDDLYRPLAKQVTKKELDRFLEDMGRQGKIINTGRG